MLNLLQYSFLKTNKQNLFIFACVHVGTRVAFSRQLAGINSRLQPCVPGDRTQVIRLSSFTHLNEIVLAGLTGLLHSFLDPALSQSREFSGNLHSSGDFRDYGVFWEM